MMVDRSELLIDHAIAEGMETALADIIRKYPVLYDKSSKSKNGSTFTDKCDTAWNKISDELNLELDSCKSLWSCMKQKFIKHRKRLDNGDSVSAWPTYNILYKWLNPHVKRRKSRQDYIKQMKLPPKNAILKTEESEETEERNQQQEEEEEWAEIVEDKNTATVQVTLKRKAETLTPIESNGFTTSKTICMGNGTKRKINIELLNERAPVIDEEQFVENESLIKDADIFVLEESRPKTPQIEIINLKETPKTSDMEENINKIERVLSNFTHSIERLSVANSAPDSNDAFGKYIASMVRELPAHKRLKVRLNILRYASELIASEASLSAN